MAQQQPDDGGTIVPIADQTVRRIVAGQAVTDLASAVKELVDNSLDAGAKSINIRLFNQGLDILEVSDDGSGVPRESRHLMATKHATSKIRSFDDIYSPSSQKQQALGFRGEALFCLANISQNLVIATRTAEEEVGQKMEFRRNGSLDAAATTEMHRKVGTTVAIVKLFDALPVRRADMMKRIKGQRARLLRMMQGYAILCTRVCFNLMDMSGGRADLKLSSSSSSTTIEQTVSSVLGSKFLSGLTRLDVDLVDGCSSEMGPSPRRSKIEGLVSKAPNAPPSSARGGTSVARDLQFFCINGRPVELPKLSRALAEAWRAFDTGGQKRPACVLCLTLPANTYDVNLSPDKREVLLTEEAIICNKLKDALTNLWMQQSSGTFAINEVETLSNSGSKRSASSLSETTPSPTRSRMRRRNAFVHDVRNARPSEETAGPPLSTADTYEQGIEGTPATQTQSDSPAKGAAEDANEENEPHPKRQLLSMASNPEPSSLESSERALERVPTIPSEHRNTSPEKVEKVTPSPGAPPPREEAAVNELDRRHWAEARERFHRNEREHQREDMQNLKSLMASSDVPRKNVSLTGPASSPTSALQATTTQSEATESSPPRRVSDESSVAKRVDDSHHSGGLGGLDRFAFNPNSHGARSVRSVSRTERVAVQKEKLIESEVPVSRRQNKGDELDMRPRRLVEDEDEANDETQLAEKGQFERTAKHGMAKNDEQDPSSSTSNGDKQQADAPPVHWNAFQGTNDVIRLYKAARSQMQHDLIDLEKAKQNRQAAVSSHAGLEERVGISGDDATNGGRMDESVTLTKDDFLKMEIIGQFNLGFVLAKCPNQHLWILDQHACDEKYNFERLCATTAIHEQKLLAPLPLELSPSEEDCVLENMEIFEKNGFRFSYDPDKPPRHRLSLTALPHSGARDGRKAVQFGKEDVGALCSLLGADGAAQGAAGSGTGTDGSGTYGNNAVRRYAGTSQGQDGEVPIVRLPKTIAMFANRACRSSIMIGTALSEKEMEAIVRKLHQVEQPWNCPHGRPTMRHVKDLIETLIEDERAGAAKTIGPTVSELKADQQEETSATTGE